jgi:sulfur carrier protein
MAMQIRLNGQPHELTPGATLADLVAQLQLTDRRIAVEVNQQLVPRSTFAGHPLQAGDQVEIVGAIGGG